MIGSPDDTLDDVAILAGALGIEDRNGHDLDARISDAGDPEPVVRLGRDDSGDGRAVAVRVVAPGRAGELGVAGHDVAVEVSV